MSELYIKKILKIIVAQIFQAIGWDAINSTPMEIIIDILDRYLKDLTRSAQHYAELCNRTQPNFNDILLAFEQMQINVKEIEEYMQNVDPILCVVRPSKITMEKESNLNFLTFNNMEILMRPPHVYSYLPPMLSEYK